VQFHDLAERLTTQLDELRDRTAETVRADSDSFFREVHQLRDSLGDLEERLDDRLERLSDEHAEALRDAIGRRGTTWPRRLFWLTLGAAAGAAAAYFASPERRGRDEHHLAPPPST
jgi:gas vesicle protein